MHRIVQSHMREGMGERESERILTSVHVEREEGRVGREEGGKRKRRLKLLGKTKMHVVEV